MDKKHLAIITDYYPPYLIGGAEISLEALVKVLKQKFHITIFVIRHDANVGLENPGNEVQVVCANLAPPIDYELYNLPTYPHHFLPQALLSKLHKLLGSQSRLLRYILSFSFYFKYLVKKHSPEIRFMDRMRLLWVNTYCMVFGRKNNLEYYDADYPFLTHSGKKLAQLLTRHEIDLVHVDNYYSIMAYQETGITLPAISMLRDLRFFCARRNKIAYTTSWGACDHCNLQCSPEQPWPIRNSLKKIFKKNKSYRQHLLKKYQQILAPTSYLAQMVQTKDLPIFPVRDIVEKLPVERGEKGQNETISIAFVGALTESKGPDLLLHAYLKLKKKHPKTQLVLIGMGPLEKDLKTLALESNDILFPGLVQRKDLGTFYQQADIIVCPSRVPEAFGRVPIEAMQQGCIVLAPAVGGFLESIHDQENGFLYDPNSENSLIYKLDHVLSHMDEWGEVKENAISYAQKYVATPSAAVVKMYDSLL